MSVEYSREQLIALETRNKDMILSASAGSGKTTVLVGRIIRMVCEEGISLENLAVVTFTNAAASGIKDKLRKELRKKTDEQPDNEHLRKQLLIINNADISTVHSFCGRLIKKYGHLLPVALPVKTRLLNETEEAVMYQECIEEVITEYYEKDDELFERMMESYSPGRNDDDFTEMLLKTYHFILSIPFYTQWIDKILHETDNQALSDYLNSHIKSVLEASVSKYELALEEVRTTEGLEKQINTFEAEYSLLSKALSETDLIKRLEIISKITFDAIPRKKNGTDNTVSSSVRNEVKDAVRSIQQNYGSFINEDFSIPPVICKYFEIIRNLDAKIKERKYSDGCISFSDQEHFAIEILSDNSVAEELKKRYYEIMVDEYQDTNDIQDYIFSRISNGRNLFTVGDVKQSIYRFRHAKPSIFTERIINGQKKESSKVVYLNNNYRSSANVTETVNLIFSYIMNSSVSDIDYKTTDMLVPKNPEAVPGWTSEVIICEDASDEEGIPLSEAQVIAEKIDSIIHKGLFFGKDSARSINYSDIAILIRSFNSKTLDFLSELTDLGIPCKYDDKINLFDTPEVKLVTAFLRAIDNPTDDISLLAVLRNVFGLSDAELFELRKSNPHSDFFTLIKKSYKRIYDEIISLSDYSSRYGLSMLINKLYNDYLIPEKWMAIGGTRRNDNLMTLVKTAREFEKDGFKSISGFLSYIDKLIATKKKIIPPDLSDGNSNCVRVMTIHKSKGLEFPVVFLAGCGNSFNKRDLSKSILHNTELGIGFNRVNPELRCRYSSISKKIIAQKELHELLSEEMRLLYVALTRAEFKLIVTGSVSNTEKRIAAYSALTYNSTFGISYIDFLNANCYFDFIIPPVLFSEKNKDTGISVPSELAGNIKNADVTLSLYTAHSNDDENKENPGDILRRLVFSEKEKGDFRVFRYEKPEREIPKKISVTALNTIASEGTSVSMPAGGYELYTPEFDKKRKLSSSQHGTMLHLVFEKTDIEALAKSRDIFGEIQKLINNNQFLKEHMTVEDAFKIESFFKHPLGIKLLRSKKVYREKEFMISAPAESIYPGSEGKNVIIQGIIDCCFEDNNGDIYLIDYKYTDKDEKSIIQSYKHQIELYKKALCKLMKITPEKIHAYIWDIKKCVSYEL